MKFNLFPKDATTVVEKVAYVMMKVFAPFLYLFLQLSAWGIFKNDYQQMCKVAGFGGFVMGFVLTAGAVIWGYALVTDSKRVTKSDILNVLILGLLTGLSLWAYTGFTS